MSETLRQALEILRTERAKNLKAIKENRFQPGMQVGMDGKLFWIQRIDYVAGSVTIADTQKSTGVSVSATQLQLPASLNSKSGNNGHKMGGDARK